MSRRTWTGLLVGLLAAIGLLAVGAGAYHAGEHHRGTAVAAAVGPGSTLSTPDGTVRVVGIDHWRGGPPIHFLFPLLFIGLIVLLVLGRRRAYWGRPWGPGYCGPGGWGPGPEGREAMMADWHKRAHGDTGPPPEGGNTA